MKAIQKVLTLVALVATGVLLHAATPPTGSQTYYGLFVGVNEFSYANYLLGCDWDAIRMMDAYTRGGFCGATNADLITNLDATKAAVRAKFNALARKAKSGDTVLYYQSSHGSDYTSATEEKGATLCLTDEEWSDVEFADDLAQFANGVRVVVVLDACFSGGMFKSANGEPAGKKGKWDFAARVQARLNARRAAAKASGAKGVPSVAWITAADWDETASMDDRGSEFSHALLAGWEDGSADTDSDGYVSFGELAEYAKDNVFDSSVQSDNDALLEDVLAGQGFDVATFRLLSANNTLYGFLGECPASVAVPAGIEAIAASAFDADFNYVDDLASVSIPASMREIGEYAFCYCENLATVTFGGDRGDIFIEATAFLGTPCNSVIFPPPANDDFEGAIEIAGTMSGSLVGTNVNASVEMSEPLLADGDASSTVWWKWTAPESGPVQFNTLGSDIDTVMGVFTGGSLADLVLVAENDDAKGTEARYSQVAFNATAGTTYYIDVGGYDGDEGSISLSWGPYDVAFSLVVDDGVLTGFEGICPTSITIPDSVTYIDDEAFRNCPLLGSVTFSEGLLGIGHSAFAGCVSLTAIALPASLDSVDDFAFSGCSRLVTVSYGGSEMTAESEGLWDLMDVESVFAGTPWLGFTLKVEDGWVVGYIGGMVAGEMIDLEIPDGIEGIEDEAFYGLVGLRSLCVPASVGYIGEYAFAECPDLEEVVFLSDSSMTESYLEIGEGAFSYCESLESVEFEDRPWDPENDIWNEIYVGTSAFEGCEALVDLYLGEGVLEIGDSAFYGIGIESLEVPASVGYIGEYAFADCPDLEEVVFLSDDSMTESYLEIGEGAFSCCESLAWVEFEDRPWDPENDVWSEICVGTGAFEGCEALVDLYLGEGVLEIGDSAFYGIGIESLEVPASVCCIGDDAFAYCESLMDVCFYGYDVYGHDYGLDVDIESAFKGTPWLTAVPSNDDFADAEVLVGESGCLLGRNRNATVEVGESHRCYPTATVWYKWTPKSDGTYRFVVDADYDSILGVYTGSSVGSLTRVAFNDDADGYSSALAFDAAAGKTYYIAVGGYEDDEGAFTLEWGPFEYEIEFEIDDKGVLTGFGYNMFIPSTITIPEGVVSIAESMFEEYDGIFTVNLPSTLKSIGDYAFSWCYDLANVNGLTDSIETGAFAFHMTPFDEARAFGLDVVGNCVLSFHGRPCPATLTIPENATNIAEWAFCYDDYGRWEYDEEMDDEYEIDNPLANLRSAVFPSSVVSISRWAFEDCTNLASVAVANPGIKIDGSAFNGCAALTAINLEKTGYSLAGWDLFRDKNPGWWIRSWDEETETYTNVWEEYEADFIPTGTVVRIESLESLVYGMPTDVLRTNWLWNAETGSYDIMDVRVVTNDLEGVWATPAWTPNKYTLTFDAAGGSAVAPITQDYGTAVKAPAAPSRRGYTFTGWTPAVPATMPAEDMKLTAQWTPNRYTVAFNANGGKGSMAAQAFVYDAEQLLSECAFERTAHEFLGWSLAPDSDEIAFFDGENVLNLTAVPNGNVKLYAVWERTSLWAPVADISGGSQGGGAGGSGWDNMFGGDAAEVYDGYLLHPDTGLIVGTIQVKVSKAKVDRKTQMTSAKVSAAVQLVTEKKVTLSGVLDMETGRFVATDKSGREMILLIGANSLSGSYGKYLIDGAQNKFTTKDADAKAIGAAALARYQGAWTVAWPAADGSGWNGMSLTVAAKGKVKAAGLMADGTKVAVNSTLLVGDDGVCVIPVVVAKKVQLAFTVWLSSDGVEVVGLKGAVPGVRKVDALAGGSAVNFDAAAFCKMIGDSTFADCLPIGLSVAQEGSKWVVADGAKAGKVQLTKEGTLDEAKAGVNPSALKIAFTAKAGTFKGTFKAYSLVNGKPKATTVTVNGVLVDGAGYGAAFVKKLGGVPLTIK